MHIALVKTPDGRTATLGFEDSEGLRTIRLIAGVRVYILADEALEKKLLAHEASVKVASADPPATAAETPAAASEAPAAA